MNLRAKLRHQRERLRAVAEIRRQALATQFARYRVHNEQPLELIGPEDPKEICHLLDRLGDGGQWESAGAVKYTCRDALAGSAPDYPMAAFRTGSVIGHRLRGVGWHLHQRWADMHIDLRTGPEAVLMAASRSLRQELAHLREGGWETRISHCPGDLEMFDQTMYRPTLEAAHGNRGTFFDLGSMRRLFREGFLIQAFHRGQWVGADLAVEVDASLWLAVTGWVGGDPGLKKQKVVTLLTHAGIREASRLGKATLDYGPSIGFATEGNLLYKVRWGATPVVRGYQTKGGRFYARDWTDIGLWVDTSDLATQNALDRTQPLVDVDGVASALTWSAQRPNVLKRAHSLGWVRLVELEA